MALRRRIDNETANAKAPPIPYSYPVMQVNIQVNNPDKNDTNTTNDPISIQLNNFESGTEHTSISGSVYSNFHALVSTMEAVSILHLGPEISKYLKTYDVETHSFIPGYLRIRRQGNHTRPFLFDKCTYKNNQAEAIGNFHFSFSVMLRDIKEPVFNRPTRGFVDGCFDLMHSGHFNAIRQAKGVFLYHSNNHSDFRCL